jgi:hypothetical protein
MTHPSCSGLQVTTGILATVSLRVCGAFSHHRPQSWCCVLCRVQNRVAELYSLIRFLRIYPYAHYFCNKCDCSSIDFPFTKVRTLTWPGVHGVATFVPISLRELVAVKFCIGIATLLLFLSLVLGPDGCQCLSLLRTALADLLLLWAVCVGRLCVLCVCRALPRVTAVVMPA